MNNGKILYVVPSYFRGRESLFIDLAENFDLKIIEVAHYAKVGIPSERYSSIVHPETWRLHGFKFRKGMKWYEYFIIFYRLFKEFKSTKYSVVISSTEFPVYADMIWFLQPFFGYRLVFVNEVWEMPKGVGKLHHKWVRFMLKRATAVLSRGKRSSEYLIDHLGVPAKKVKPWPLICEAPEFCSEELPCSDVFKKYERTVKFLYMGRFIKEKGLFELLDAFEKLQKRNPDVSLFLVGGYGKDEEQLIKRISSIPNCESIGWLDPKYKQKIYGSCDVFVLPSYYDGYSTATSEAASCGLPFIITDRTGCWPDLMQGEDNGSLIKTKDVDSLLNAMERWSNYSKEEIKRRGNIGYEIFSRLSDSKVHIKSLNEILETK